MIAAGDVQDLTIRVAHEETYPQAIVHAVALLCITCVIVVLVRAITIWVFHD